MPRQVRNDPSHKKEIARRRLDRAQRKPGQMVVSAPGVVGAETGAKFRRTFLTAAQGGYRVATPPQKTRRTVKHGTKTYNLDQIDLVVGGKAIKSGTYEFES